MKNNSKINIFRMVSALEALSTVPDLSYALRTIEKEGNTYIVENYEYGIELLLDNAFPWRSVWKILLTLTFPSKKLLTSRLLSPKSKAILGKVRYYTKSYEKCLYILDLHI